MTTVIYTHQSGRKLTRGTPGAICGMTMYQYLLGPVINWQTEARIFVCPTDSEAIESFNAYCRTVPEYREEIAE